MTRRYITADYEEVLDSKIRLGDVLPASHLARFVVSIIGHMPRAHLKHDRMVCRRVGTPAARFEHTSIGPTRHDGKQPDEQHGRSDPCCRSRPAPSVHDDGFLVVLISAVSYYARSINRLRH